MHVIAGTFRGDRHDPTGDVVAPDGRPARPKDLKGEARAEWDRMVGRLEQTHTLSVVDDAALYQYCKLHAETEAIESDRVATRRMAEDLKRQARKLDGAELVEAITQIVKLKAIEAKYAVQLRQGRMALRQYLVEFGMTPSARTRVKPIKGAGQVQKSKLGEFLAGARA